jgi:hypothetical protein
LLSGALHFTQARSCKQIIKGVPVYTQPRVDNPDHFIYYTIDFEGTEQAYDYDLVTSASLAAAPAPIANPTIFRLINNFYCLVDSSVAPQGSCLGVVPDEYALPFYKWNGKGSAELQIKGHHVTVVVTPPAEFARYAHYSVVSGIAAQVRCTGSDRPRL